MKRRDRCADILALIDTALAEYEASKTTTDKHA